jgi:hypothetical protein
MCSRRNQTTIPITTDSDTPGGCRRVRFLRLLHVAAADGLGYQGAGGAGDGQRQHVEHGADIGRDLVAGHRHRTQARDEDRHQREGGDFDEVGHADRNAQPQQLALAFQEGDEAAAEQLERPIVGQSRHQQPGGDHHQPGDQGGGDGAAGAAEGEAGPGRRRSAGHSGQLQQQAAELMAITILGRARAVLSAE